MLKKIENEENEEEKKWRIAGMKQKKEGIPQSDWDANILAAIEEALSRFLASFLHAVVAQQDQKTSKKYMQSVSQISLPLNYPYVNILKPFWRKLLGKNLCFSFL